MVLKVGTSLALVRPEFQGEEHHLFLFISCFEWKEHDWFLFWIMVFENVGTCLVLVILWLEW
jgi:hypothetical protein